MPTQWSRRRLVLAAACATAVLAACGGGGTVESQLQPARIVAFGDGMADLAQAGNRYTVNDGSTNIWTQQLASRYGRTLETAARGGTSFAVRNARVAARPDAVGNAATPTVTEQIGGYLAAQTFAANDLVVVSAGTSDIVAEGARVISGAQTAGQATANARQAGRDLGAQVRRLVQSGARHVAVAGPYNLGRSPWARATGQAALLQSLSSAFNEDLLVSIVDLGANVLYIDAALYYNLVTGSPASYSMSNVGDPLCTSVDAGVGNGTGSGQVNSALCTPSTLAPALDPARTLFADGVYPTPQGHRLLGDYAYDRIRQRW